MKLRLLLFSVLAALFGGCQPKDEWYLDWAIPRIATPSAQIATVRTKWINGKLQQTTFLDKQNRILEDFKYGRTSEKTLNQYTGDNNVVSIHYHHSDSSPGGHVTIDTTRRGFDKLGKVITEEKTFAWIEPEKPPRTTGHVGKSFAYTAEGDTIITRQTGLDTTGQVPVNKDVNQWERDRNGRIIRHNRLLVWKGHHRNLRPDTVEYYSQRIAYDSAGRRTLAWFDLIYLGEFYWSVPDTVRYIYDKQNRLTREVHRFTTDKRNKVLPDTSSLEKSERVGRGFPTTAKTNLVEYRYEPFNPGKHLPLRVSIDIDY